MPVVSVPPRGVGGRRPGGRSVVVRAAACLALVLAAGAGAAEPVPSVAARAAYASAAALQNRGAWDLAAQEWQALLRDHPADALVAKARYQLGICRAKLGDWPAAAEAFRGVVTQAGADAETVALARFEWAKGTLVAAQATAVPADYGAAAALLGETVTAGVPPGLDTEARWYLGEARWQAGDREGALAAWREAATAIPDSRAAATPRLADVLHSLGVAEAEAGDGSAALATLGRFAMLFPTHPLAADVTLRRADLLVADDPRAAEKLLLPLASGPRADAALDRIGAARWKRADWKGAAEAYGRLADLHARSPLASAGALAAGMALAEAGDRDGARRRFAALLAGRGVVPARAGRELARLEARAGDPHRAADAAERGLAALTDRATEPGLVAALESARADALWEVPTRRAEAIAAYQRLVREHPDAEVADSARAMLALAALEAGRTDEALRAAEALLARVGDQPVGGAAVSLALDAAAIRAEALLASGDGAAAADAYGRLIDRAGGDARRGTWLARHGAALAAAEEWSDAADALARALPLLQRDPGAGNARSDALLLYAGVLLELGRPGEAEATLERLAREVPRSPRRVEAELLAIRARLDSGDVEGALERAERLDAEEVDEAFREAVAFRLGETRRAAGRDAEAVEAYDEVVRRAPDGPRAAASLAASGWCRARAGDLADAIARWTRVIDRDPDGAAARSARLGRADALQRLGDTAAALADAEHLLARHAEGSAVLAERTLAETRLVAGICLMASGRPADAAAVFDRVLADQPAFAGADRVLWERGMAAVALADGPAAATAFNQLVERFPASPRAADAWLELGEAAFAEGRAADAADCYRRAVAAAGSGPIVEQAWHKLGWVHAVGGDHAAARAAFTAQLDAAPAGSWAADGQVLLGRSLFELGRIEEAGRALDAALAEPQRISSAPLRALALVRASEVAALEGAWERSLARAEEALVAHAGEAGAADGTPALARYAAAWARQNLGRLDEAREGFRALADAAATPLAARARLMEGEVLFEQGRHEEAIRVFFKVVADQNADAAYRPWRAQAAYEAARCFEVLRQTDQARRLYAEVVERFPESPQVAAARTRLAALGGPLPRGAVGAAGEQGRRTDADAGEGPR